MKCDPIDSNEYLGFRKIDKAGTLNDKPCSFPYKPPVGSRQPRKKSQFISDKCIGQTVQEGRRPSCGRGNMKCVCTNYLQLDLNASIRQ